LKDDSHGEFVFDWNWATSAERRGLAYYPKLVVASPFTPATGRRLLVAQGEDRPARERELLSGLLGYARSERLSSVHVLFHTEAETRVLEEAGFAIRHGVQYQWRNEGYRDFEDFLGRFHSRRRNQIHRERQAIERQGITLRTLRGEELASVDPQEVYALYRSTVARFVWGRQHLTEDFFRRILGSFRHRLELVEARKGGRRVAGALNLATAQVLYGRYWGCFEELPFLHFNACQYFPVEESIQRGRTRFEPGAGGEHKLVRGFEPALTWSAHRVFDRELDGEVRHFLEAERTAIQQGLPKWRRETGFKAPSVGGARKADG
jgi:predicted N-acyltransferase